MISTMSCPTFTVHRGLLFGLLVAAGMGALTVELVFQPRLAIKSRRGRRRRHEAGPGRRKSDVVDDVTGLIGNTPLVRIKSLSEMTGCDIFGKCEFLNPGGSVKDRVALQIIRQAEQAGEIEPHTHPRCRVFEGTSGSTGISLAYVARALGYEAEIVLPDDTAREKSDLIDKMGATVIKVRPVSISNRSHYVNVARDRARLFELQGGARGFFVDQFENQANWLTHYQTTGPEIWNQTKGKVDVFVSGAGTGGTIAGVSKFLKRQKSDVQIILADPPGSGLFNKVKHGVMFSKTEAEGKRRRHQVDTIIEGIGSNRMTANIDQAIGIIDDAINVTDEEAIKMSRFILSQDGLFLGSSSCVNLVAAYKLAKAIREARNSSEQALGGNPARRTQHPTTVVTILCDSGQRHMSKFWNDEYLLQNGYVLNTDTFANGLDGWDF